MDRTERNDLVVLMNDKAVEIVTIHEVFPKDLLLKVLKYITKMSYIAGEKIE